MNRISVAAHLCILGLAVTACAQVTVVDRPNTVPTNDHYVSNPTSRDKRKTL